MRFCIMELLAAVQYEDYWGVFEQNRTERSLVRLITQVEEKMSLKLQEEFAKGGYTIKVIPKQNFKWYDTDVTKYELEQKYLYTLQFEIKVFDSIGEIGTLEKIPFKKIGIITFCNTYAKKFASEANNRGVSLIDFIRKLT